MAITRTNIQEIDTGATPAVSLTLSNYTPSTGSNRVLEVAIACGRTLPPACSVTFGGVAMTQRAFIESDGSAAVAVGMYTLNETDWPSTPSDIVATLNGTGGIRMVASTLTNVDQTTPMDTTPVTVQMGLNVQPWSIGITTATHGALVSAFGAGNDPRTLGELGSNQTQIQYDTDVVEVTTNDISRTLLWEYTDVASPTSVTMTAVWNSGHARAALITVAYRPAKNFRALTHNTSPSTTSSYSTAIVNPAPTDTIILMVALRSADFTTVAAETLSVSGCATSWSQLQRINFDSSTRMAAGLFAGTGPFTSESIALKFVSNRSCNSGAWMVTALNGTAGTPTIVQSNGAAHINSAADMSTTLAPFASADNWTLGFALGSPAAATFSEEAGYETPVIDSTIRIAVAKTSEDTNVTFSRSTNFSAASFALEYAIYNQLIPLTKTVVRLNGKNAIVFGSGPNIVILS